MIILNKLFVKKTSRRLPVNGTSRLLVLSIIKLLYKFAVDSVESFFVINLINTYNNVKLT